MKTQKNLKRILISSVLSLISIGLILYFTTTENTFRAIRNIQPFYLLFILGIWFLAVSLDSVGIIFFVRGTGEKIRLRDCYRVTALRIFFNLITPFSFGGQPFIVYILKKLGIPSGKGSSIVITRLLTVSFFSFLSGVFAFVFFGDRVSGLPPVKYAFLVTGILMICMFIFCIIGLLYPPMMISVAAFLSKVLFKLRIVKDKRNFMHSTIRELINARNSFKNYFRKHLFSFVCGVFCFGFMYFAQVFILFYIIKGLGIALPFVEGFALCALMIFLIAFMPTPGSSGLGEALFIIIFAGAVPKYMLGLAVILWRTFSQYLSALFGAIFSAGLFSRFMVKDREKTAPPAQ